MYILQLLIVLYNKRTFSYICVSTLYHAYFSLHLFINLRSIRIFANTYLGLFTSNILLLTSTYDTFQQIYFSLYLLIYLYNQCTFLTSVQFSSSYCNFHYFRLYIFTENVLFRTSVYIFMANALLFKFRLLFLYSKCNFLCFYLCFFTSNVLSLTFVSYMLKHNIQQSNQLL